MKAYLIDPEARTVEEHEYDGDWRSIAKALQCRVFDIVRMDDGDGIYVDDEALLNLDPDRGAAFFRLAEYPQPLVGRGLVLGSDERGESREPVLTLERVRELVSFPFFGSRLFPA